MTKHSWPAIEPIPSEPAGQPQPLEVLEAPGLVDGLPGTGDRGDELALAENADVSEQQARNAGWSVRRAIELLDAAIERMGEQLAKASSASMDWSPEVDGQLRRPLVRGRRSRVSALSAAFEAGEHERPDARGPDLP